MCFSGEWAEQVKNEIHQVWKIFQEGLRTESGVPLSASDAPRAGWRDSSQLAKICRLGLPDSSNPCLLVTEACWIFGAFLLNCSAPLPHDSVDGEKISRKVHQESERLF